MRLDGPEDHGQTLQVVEAVAFRQLALLHGIQEPGQRTGLITGTVLEYGTVRSASASANVISVSAQMMEGQTGRVVWQASATRGGIGATKRLFGGGGEPMSTVTTKAVEDLLNALCK